MAVFGATRSIARFSTMNLLGARPQARARALVGHDPSTVWRQVFVPAPHFFFNKSTFNTGTMPVFSCHFLLLSLKYEYEYPLY